MKIIRKQKELIRMLSGVWIIKNIKCTFSEKTGNIWNEKNTKQVISN